MTSKMKCDDCVYKYRCLAEHHIPENYGNDCTKYEQGIRNARGFVERKT